jgi:hypothetical protein
LSEISKTLVLQMLRAVCGTGLKPIGDAPVRLHSESTSDHLFSKCPIEVCGSQSVARRLVRREGQRRPHWRYCIIATVV